MPKYQAEDYDPQTVERLLHARQLTHLRARKYGAAAIVEAGPKDDPVKHLRLTRETVHLWLLDIADHRGRWERTPERGALKDRHPRDGLLPLDPPTHRRLPGTDFGSRALAPGKLSSTT
jgi:hypothetical protein